MHQYFLRLYVIIEGADEVRCCFADIKYEIDSLEAEADNQRGKERIMMKNISRKSKCTMRH